MEQELLTLPGAPEFTPGFQWGSCYSIFSFMCMFCRSLFVLLSFFLWLLCCLFFFDLRILITSLISSNSSDVCLSQFSNYTTTTRLVGRREDRAYVSNRPVNHQSWMGVWKQQHLMWATELEHTWVGLELWSEVNDLNHSATHNPQSSWRFTRYISTNK
jgi:hypothetical protein